MMGRRVSFLLAGILVFDSVAVTASGESVPDWGVLACRQPTPALRPTWGAIRMLFR